ncbi:permease prefix domain 1-containing protein [Mesorhizobium sp. RMAD-H1]|uniref:permease prefix domain 1-containing protein n=1 Tax=Mesorhizobium sp. RMAD-H1 TaxID=2587065 RepID=UPI00161B2AAD|nr:permease prefix domain 1-containing protein [Mesorhizobium sp. RMAD-H1]MBB2969869.1 hypothetical protein [Mesorhizobium sp. RMAD-H1]
MSPLFDPLRERLLRAGIAPRYVHRYVTELKEHLEDLTDALMEEGASRSEAEARAYARLGDEDDLAQAMMGRNDLRSWSARAPWATLVLAPLTLAIGVAACALLLIGAREYGVGPGSHPDIPAWFVGLVDAVETLSNFILPILCGWGIAVIAMRQRLQSVWPAVALALVALLGSGLQLDVALPSASGDAGSLMVGFGTFSNPRLVLNLLLILSPYLVWRKWVMPTYG